MAVLQGRRVKLPPILTDYLKSTRRMPLSPAQKSWYFDQLSALDPDQSIVRGDLAEDKLHYCAALRTDKSHTRNATPEELVHALAIVLLVKQYEYPIEALYHEKDVKHGSTGSSFDEIDLVILDGDDLPFAVWEFKSAEDYASQLEPATQYQLFGTVPLLTAGSPRHIVCATIDPTPGSSVSLKLRCIDYSQVKDYSRWVLQGATALTEFPKGYRDPAFVPYVKDGAKDLRTNCSLNEFKAVATQFHNEFFSEHPDNQLFESLVKLLLAKISSEKNTPSGEEYPFQVFYKNGRPESATEVFQRVQRLYDSAYSLYIDPTGSNPLDPNTFAPERVKSVVAALQGMALTKGSALSADVMGAFFEEILRAGFKQDRGMYFTHDNIARFMGEAVGLRGLTEQKWTSSGHPNSKLPYVIDPACGSGTFLLHAMQIVTDSVRSNRSRFVRTEADKDFFRTHFSDESPNAWAKDFLYGFDYKFIMALTAKVNMVLHGDGVTHIFKDDAYKPLTGYVDSKFRPVGEAGRSLSAAQYPRQVCETFDVVISNPPFGVTLSPATQAALSTTFTLAPSNVTEALFIERAFQLLRPHGRLAVVLPESVLNAAESAEARKLLYRLFHIKAVVLLPRNIFVDTPTLTSLLFAQKKSADAVAAWDLAWGQAKTKADAKVSDARNFTKTGYLKQGTTSAQSIEAGVISALGGIVGADSWVTKSGANARVLTLKLPSSCLTKEDAAAHYKDLLFGAGFDALVEQYIFGQVAQSVNYPDWACYTVEEVGFKLSKRREKARENQLMSLVTARDGQLVQNLHLVAEPTRVTVNESSPSRVLDFIASDVVWSI